MDRRRFNDSSSSEFVEEMQDWIAFANYLLPEVGGSNLQSGGVINKICAIIYHDDEKVAQLVCGPPEKVAWKRLGCDKTLSLPPRPCPLSRNTLRSPLYTCKHLDRVAHLQHVFQTRPVFLLHHLDVALVLARASCRHLDAHVAHPCQWEEFLLVTQPHLLCERVASQQ